VVQATLVDTWASTAAGAFALSENNLYTTEAFIDYLTHLTGDGLLAFTRWGFEPPRESLRLVSLAIEALWRLGEREAWRHVIVAREGTAAELARWGARDTVIIARKPLAEGDILRARHAASEGKMEVVYAPGDRPANAFGALLTSPDPRRFERDYPFDISPVSDNRPFFFYTVQPRDLWDFLARASRLSADYNINRAVPTLFGLVAVSLLATAIILALPPLLLGARLPRERRVFRHLGYFLFLGAGYIMIEVALIQRFVLLLGHPTYALTVVVFSMLVSSGLGSYFSRRVTQNDDARLRITLLAIAACVASLALAVPTLIQVAAGWPLAAKVAATVLLVGPSGFLMGIPFPAGMSRLEARYPAAVRWAWALNAASSVMGSAGAVFLAIYAGLRETLLTGGALYLLAMVMVRLTTAVRVKPEMSPGPHAPRP
jgi:hypothetical protein